MEIPSDSEFGSEDEDAEFALYAKLYFEPNEDLKEEDSNTKIGIHETSSSVAYRAAVEKCPMENVIEVTTGLHNSSSPTSFVTQPLLKEDCKNVLKEKPVNIWPHSKRKREASVCSVESISGNVPLDNLYCNVMDSFSEEEVAAVNTLNQNIVNAVSKSKICKLEKPLLSNNFSDDDDSRCKKLKNLGSNKGNSLKSPSLPGQSIVNDSIVLTSADENNQSVCGQSVSGRCDNSEKRQVKKRKKKKKNDIVWLDSSDSDSSVYCISPPPNKGMFEHIVNVRKVTATSNTVEDGDVVLQSSTTVNQHSFSKHNGKVVVSGMDESFGSNVVRPELKKLNSTKNIYSDVLLASSSSESDSYFLNKCPSVPKLVMNFKDKTTDDKLGFAPSKGCKDKYDSTKQVKSVQSFDFTKGRPPTQKVPSCSKWTKEMSTFYDSDVSDFFDIDEIHVQQSAAKSDWKIHPSDKNIALLNRFRYFSQPRCRRCRQFGHTVENCPRVPHCHFCAETSHIFRNECPSNCCFRCGGPYHRYCPLTSATIKCLLCKGKGHMKDKCPDLWRRYHATIIGSLPVKPVSPQAQVRRYCCVCARKGHFGFECNTRKSLPYIVQQQSVFSYVKPVYEAHGKLFIKTAMKNKFAATNMSQNTVKMLEVQETLEAEPLEHEPLNPDGTLALASMRKNRSKRHIMSTLMKRLDYYRNLGTKLPELPAAIGVLRNHLNHKNVNKRATPELKRSLILTSLLIQGHLKYGSGEHLIKLLYCLEKVKPERQVPKNLVNSIMKSLGAIDNPHFLNSKNILRFAEAYLKTKTHPQKNDRNDINMKNDTFVIESQEMNTGKQNALKDLRNDAQLTLNNCSSEDRGISGVANGSLYKETKKKMVSNKKKGMKNNRSRNLKPSVNDQGLECATKTVRKMSTKKKKVSAIHLGREESNGNPNIIVKGVASTVEKRIKRKIKNLSESGVSEYSKAKKRRKIDNSEVKQNSKGLPQCEKRKSKNTKLLDNVTSLGFFSKVVKKFYKI